MDIDIFRPDQRKEESFAVAVPTSGPMAIIRTYSSREQLEEGYREWRNYAETRKITRPVPIERIEGRTWKILSDIIDRFPNN